MGCCGSKSDKKKKLVIKIEDSGVDEVDSIFEPLKDTLTTLAEVYNTLNKGVNKMKRRTHSYLLKDCTLKDSVTAFFYALSGQTNGDFDEVELKIELEQPYILISKHKVHNEFHEVIDAWNYLIDKFQDALSKMIYLPEKLATLVQEAPTYGYKVKEALDSAGDLSYLEKIKATKAIIKNGITLSKVPTLLKNTKNMMDELEKTFKTLYSLIMDNEYCQKIHHIGKEIHKNKDFNMREIVVKYWPDKTRLDLKLERPRKVKKSAEH